MIVSFDPAFVFIHVPKTATAAFSRCDRSAAAADLICVVPAIGLSLALFSERAT